MYALTAAPPGASCQSIQPGDVAMRLMDAHELRIERVARLGTADALERRRLAAIRTILRPVAEWMLAPRNKHPT